MISVTYRGKLKRTMDLLENIVKLPSIYYKVKPYALRGAQALSAATPIDTGETAASWDYEIEVKGSNVKIIWTNSNIVDGVPIAIILQYGHATNGGGYVQGQDYINPALKPIFDEISELVWREVTNT